MCQTQSHEADEERDLTAWLGNNLQDESFDRLYELAEKAANSGDESIARDWAYLQASDHFYYMCTKWFSDGEVHKYFTHYPSPYEAYINFMNVLADFTIRVKESNSDTKEIMDEILASGAKLGTEIGKAVKNEIRKTADSLGKRIKKETQKVEPHLDALIELSDKKVKEIVKDLEAEELIAALDNAKQELIDKVLPNLSKQTRKKYDELKAQAAKTSKSQAAKVRKAIGDKLDEILK